MNTLTPLLGALDPRVARPTTRLTDATDVVMYGYLDNYSVGNLPSMSYVNSYLIR